MGNHLPYGLGGRGHCVGMLGGGKVKVKHRASGLEIRDRRNSSTS